MRSRVLPDTRSFATEIAKIRAKGADGVAVCLLPGSLASFAKQARDLNLKAELFGFELFEDENEVAASDGALIGKWYINADEVNDSFRAKYSEKYGEQPGWATANAFDTLNLLADGLSENDSDNDKLVEFLRGVKNYKGAAGVYSASGDNRFDLPATVKIVTEDGFKKLY
jgi:ABC-type branched-subunit amino acid transport system substrate-binding protein